MRIHFLSFLLLLVTAQSASSQQIPFQTGHTHDILEVKFSPDDSQLISYSGGDGWLCLWEVRTGRLLWKTRTGFIQKGEEYYALQEFYWSEDRNLIVTKSNNGTYQTWDAKTGEILSHSDDKPKVKLDVRNRIIPRNDEDTSSNGELIATGGRWGDASIKITDTKTGKSHFLDGHPSVIKAIAYSPDGNYLAVAGSDKNIYIFDAAKHTLSKMLAGHTAPVSSLAFSPDGKILLSGDDRDLIKAWDWHKGNYLQDINSGGGIWGTKKIEFSKDGKHLLAVSERTLKIWDTHNWKYVREIKTAEEYEETGGNVTIGYSSVPVSTAIFVNNGKSVLSSHVDGTFRVWEMGSGKQIKRFKIGGEAPFVLLSYDEKTILAGIGESDEFQIKLFDAQSGKALRELRDENTNYTKALAISPNGKNFATSNITGDVFLWDVNKSRPIRELDIGFSGDDAIAFSPDGKTLAVGGRNQNLFLFDVEAGNKLWQLIPSYQPSQLEIRLRKEKEQRRLNLNKTKAQ